LVKQSLQIEQRHAATPAYTFDLMLAEPQITTDALTHTPLLT
jgi:hypothetical protein